MSYTGIVQGKSFNTQDQYGNELWQKINTTFLKYFDISTIQNNETEFIYEDTEWPGYGNSILQKVRVGQGAFRILVTDAYNRRCSISGEKTLAVLEAAHIKPYNQEGPQKVSNGLLLRSDIHKLFDSNYITITKEYRIEVSKAIKEEFENGKEYYKFHGNKLAYLPDRKVDQPDVKFIEWHNNYFKG
jgi:putative restriction endonuclease